MVINLNTHPFPTYQNICCISSWEYNSQVKTYRNFKFDRDCPTAIQRGLIRVHPTSNVPGHLAHSVTGERQTIPLLKFASSYKTGHIPNVYWLLVSIDFACFSGCWSFSFWFGGTLFIKEISPSIWHAFQFIFHLDYFIGSFFHTGDFYIVEFLNLFFHVSGFGVICFKTFPTPRL